MDEFGYVDIEECLGNAKPAVTGLQYSYPEVRGLFKARKLLVAHGTNRLQK